MNTKSKIGASQLFGDKHQNLARLKFDIAGLTPQYMKCFTDCINTGSINAGSASHSIRVIANNRSASFLHLIGPKYETAKQLQATEANPRLAVQKKPGGKMELI